MKTTLTAQDICILINYKIKELEELVKSTPKILTPHEVKLTSYFDKRLKFLGDTIARIRDLQKICLEILVEEEKDEIS